MIYLCSLVLVACLVLGGGTYAGFLSDVIVQLLSIPLLMYAIWRLPGRFKGRASSNLPSSTGARSALALCVLAVLLPVVQLIPLPPSIWTRLPGRETVVAAFGLIEQGLPWMPLSVTPRATWLSGLSVLPPLALLLGTLHLSYAERRRLTLVLLAVGLSGALLGLLQVAQGQSSPLRLFPITNPSEAVGFFANRNHFAALLYCLMLLTAAWAVEVTAPGEAPGRAKAAISQSAQLVPIMACFAALVVLVAAQSMARSRAGLGLTIVALFGGLALAASDRRNLSGVTAVKLIAGAVVLAITFTLQMTLYRVLDRFNDPLEDARIQFAQRTIEAAKSFMPFGAGMGSFVQVYPMFEQPQDAIRDSFANRAHNDIFEFWLEAGIIGLVLMVAFAAWLVFRAVAVWRRAPPGARQLDHALARASTLIIALLLAHSFVDYPLRTEAMLAVMAVACGLLIAPPESLTEPTAAAEAAAYDNSRSEPQRTRVIIPVGGTEPPAFPAMPPERPSPPAGPPVAWPTETAPPPQPHQAVPPDQSVPPAFPAMQPAPPRVPPGQPAGPVEWAPAVTAPNRQPKAPPNAGADEWPAEWSKSTTAETPSTAPAQTPRPNPAAWRKPVDS